MMLRKSLLLAVLFVLFSSLAVKAACTVEEAQAKADDFMKVAMELAQKDPQKYGELAQAMQTQLPELQKSKDLESLCKFYDEWTGKLKK